MKYRGIEEASGIRFYQEAGFLSLIDDKYQDTERLREALEKLRSLGYEYDDINDNTRFVGKYRCICFSFTYMSYNCICFVLLT